jgi:uncharacterized membrane protein (DUF2068 family)
VAERRAGLVVLIGAFKLLKAVLLTAAGVALLLALPEQIGRQVEHAVQWVGLATGRARIEALIGRLWTLDASVEKRLALFSLGYAVVFAIEGVGLVLRRRWAEWLTVVVTGSFIPLEIYEMVRHFGLGKLVTLVLNVAIVIYLIWRRLQDRGKARAPSPTPNVPGRLARERG